MNPRAALTGFTILWAILAPAQSGAETQEVIGPMTIRMPSNWRREVRPDGAVAYQSSEAQGAGEVQFMSVNTPAADAAAVHQALWVETRRQLQAHAHENSGRLARFHWSQMEAFDPAQNRRIWLRLYTTGEGAVHVCALVGSDHEDAFQRNVQAIDAVLSRAQFAGASRPATAPGLDATPIIEALIHVDVRSVSLGSNVLIDHILLFGNGLAVRTGVIDGPRECYAALSVANLDSLPRNYGRWRELPGGGQRDIAWQEGPPWRLMRQGEHWSLEGKKLPKLRPIDGARFDGTYIYRPVGGAPTTLTFTANGRFEAANLSESMVCATNSPFIEHGGGSYEVRKWTLLLEFDGGRGRVLLPLHIQDDERDLQRVGAFAIKSYGFTRM